MRYSVQFQQMNESKNIPEDYTLNEVELIAEDGKITPIPNVDDYIHIYHKLYKVRTKLFTYLKENCWINIVLTEIPLDINGIELYSELVNE